MKRILLALPLVAATATTSWAGCTCWGSSNCTTTCV
jgi:hypothetical protein